MDMRTGAFVGCIPGAKVGIETGARASRSRRSDGFVPHCEGRSLQTGRVLREEFLALWLQPVGAGNGANVIAIGIEKLEAQFTHTLEFRVAGYAKGKTSAGVTGITLYGYQRFVGDDRTFVSKRKWTLPSFSLRAG